MIRSLKRAAKVPGATPPYDTIHVRMYYPAVHPTAPPNQVTIQFRVDETKSPLTIVIFLPEVNVEAARYHWLGLELAERGIMLVTTQWVAETKKGDTALVPGAVALKSILDVLEIEHNAPNSILNGHLRLNCLVFGGHATGGSLALLRQDPELYKRIAGAITYSALHTWEYEEQAHHLPDIPVLIMEGAKSANNCQSARIKFENIVPSSKGEAYLMILQQADEMSVTKDKHQLDDTPDEVRQLMVEAIDAFIRYHILGIEQLNLVDRFKNSPLVKEVIQR